MISRRSFVTTIAAAPAARLLAGRAALQGVRIGVTDWNLRQTGKVEAVALAKSLGFEGVEVSLGRKPNGDKLPLADPEVQKRYLEAARTEGIALAGTCLDILHVNYLKNDKLGQKWVADGIPITKTLNARVMLLPFFGNGKIEAAAEQDYVADALRELAPEAAKAGIILALENTISAEANARILDRVKSDAVKVYYDVGNSTNAGFDPVKEIRWLGAARIGQMHLKEQRRAYLGEGKIDFPAIMRAISDIGFRGFANLETDAPSGSIADDMKKNLAYIRKVVEDTGRS